MTEERLSSNELSKLTAAVVSQEEERAQRAETKEVLFADDLLPGVGGEAMSLREGITRGGAFTIIVLTLITGLDELESSAISLLAPDIRDAFGVSDGLIVFIAAAAGAFLVFGSLPMGWLADRLPRGPIIGIANLAFAGFVALSGAAVNAFMLVLARFGAGISKANLSPVHSSLIADAYPIEVRGRVGAVKDGAGRLASVLSPILVGGVAALAGWRWGFVVAGLPVALVAIAAFRLPEPPRGQFEKSDVLGEVITESSPAPISVEAAFARLLQIRTLKTVLLAFTALGFGLLTVPILQNLFLEDQYDVGTFGRGVVGSLMGVGVLATLPWVARYYDRLYRQDPERALRLVGLLVMPAALATPFQYYMPNVVLFTILGIPFSVLLSSAFVMVGPLIQTVTPYRLRGMGAALAAVYVFFFGATGGAVVAGLIANTWGTRAAVIILALPSTFLGGFLLLRGAGFIRQDLSLVVSELREEMEEHNRQLEDPENIPALQVADIDFSYGHVQVLFGVDLEVRKGEVLALLGTNGSGKSTLLRVITGLGTPSRGAVRLHGKTITYVSPEHRVRMGVHMLPGGKGVFPDMSVRANLRMGAYAYRKNPEDMERRIERVLDLFPVLSERQNQLASTLSGGQQQILALSRTLLHDPDVLIIDELSLGLAPVVVRDLLAIVERLKAEGLTILIVEQSLNIALSVADRAIFLEKGTVRFSGSAQELADRDDLARAVFFTGEGG